MALTEYEIARQKNVERNAALLKSLNLDSFESYFPTKPKELPKPKKKPAPKKRKQEAALKSEEKGSGDEGADARPRKAARVADEDGDGAGLRRSSRNSGKKVDYAGIEQDRSARAFRTSTLAKETMGSEPRDANKRTQDPKQYGPIPGVEVGTWWETRQACSTDAIHAPWVGGISNGPKGAYSVALSGGYDDDVDMGYGFTYTGSGGRDLKGTKEKPKNLRTAPQSSDQTFENNFNKSLKLSSESKQPIRVIRGFKLQSVFAPAEGYRYDGLYTVEKAWQEVGLNTQYLVCKYAFKRLPGQPRLPERDLKAEAREAENATSDAESGDEEEDEDEDEDEETQVDSTQETESSTTQVDEGVQEDNKA
ncbi:PUA-like domain-containing protein [Phellopilus nigrolimitatus]|nr:PUA-like domain-containing protein [Phellopilus nigrolimitatus]